MRTALMTNFGSLLLVSFLIVSTTHGLSWEPIGAVLHVELPGNGNYVTTQAFLLSDDSENGRRWSIDRESLDSCKIPGLTIQPMEGILESSYLQPIVFSVDPAAFKAPISDFSCQIFAELEFQESRKTFYLDVDVTSDWCTYHDKSYCLYGTCNNSTHVCDCDTDFYGPNCYVYCSNVTCLYRGSCAADGSCLCSENYYGGHCERFCKPAITCSNHGSCTSFGFCECRENYFGENCSTFCNATAMCSGQGSCDFFGTGCNCTNTHWGQHCENECACSEHGHCDATGHCICDTDYYGESCTVACNGYDNCSMNGACSETGEQCVCYAGYAGSRCQFYLVYVGIVGGVVGLVVIALGIWGLVRCSRKKQRYQQIQ